MKMRIFSKETNSCESKGRLYGDVFIPHEFENIILRHVLINSLDYNKFKPAPLLFLQGKKGEGKSYMTETILKGNNIHYKSISSSVLSGSKEGDAVNNLMMYYNACKKDTANNKYTALVIDDFHLSIAITRNSAGHTTNADNLLEALMSIADRKKELKAPIILIGNNFVDAYAPLTRAGRATICTWRPTLEDKKEIVRHMIVKCNRSAANIQLDDIYKFVERYQDQYIGFFEEVIESVCFNKMEQITDYFAQKKGNVSMRELANMVEHTIGSNEVTIAKIEEQAQILLHTKFEKLDT